MDGVTFFASPDELRAWFAANAATADELWIGFHKKASGNGGVTYAQALDEALCIGWIDGIRKRLDAESFTNRFTPRRPRSNWSAVNIARVEELSAEGRMHPAGLAAYAKRNESRSGIYSYEQRPTGLDDDSLKLFQANEPAWFFFERQAPSYRRTAAHWVLSAKKEETRRSRLATLIADSEAGRRLAHLSYTPKPLDPSPN